MQKKQKNPRFTTPVGTAIYPWITKADTKFNPEGDYRCKLRIPSEEAQKLMKEVTEATDKAVNEATLEKKKKVKVAPVPFTEVIDDNGQETGEIDFNFKRKASFLNKEGKKVDIRIPIFDSAGNQVNDINLFGGSKIKISFEMIPYSTAIGTGVSLRMLAVQVLELVDGSGGSSSSFGFGQEEGFVGSKNKVSEEDDSSDNEDSSDEEDF